MTEGVAVAEEEDNSVKDEACETKDKTQQQKKRTINLQLSFSCGKERKMKMMRLLVAQSATARNIQKQAATSLGVVET
jgi:hypothetical protein